jgi:hypothetical protein
MDGHGSLKVRRIQGQGKIETGKKVACGMEEGVRRTAQQTMLQVGACGAEFKGEEGEYTPVYGSNRRARITS